MWSVRFRYHLSILAVLALAVVPLDGAAAQKKPKPQDPRHLEEGLASWFRTKHFLSAAHRTLPFGSRIKVRSHNGRSVIVTITDRGPFIKGRVIDLSKDAFKKLASLRTGLITVKLERVTK